MKATMEIPDELEPVPEWFGSLRKYARGVKRHDMEAVRESIARGITADRSL